MTDVVTLVIAVVGVLGIGSVIAQWFGAGAQRRESRAAALTALQEVERLRWSTQEDDAAFVTAVHRLETAALIARVPRVAVIHYAVMATSAAWMASDNMVQRDEGIVWEPLGEMVRRSAEVLVRAIWRPWPLSRLGLMREIGRIDRLAESMDDTDHEYLTRARRKWLGTSAATPPA